MAPLPNLGYELINPPLLEGDGVTFGRGTKIHVQQVNFGSPELRINDEPNARSDGMRMGRDYLNGRMITFDINIKTNKTEIPSAHTLYKELEAAWFTEDTFVGASRLTPGDVSQLRMNRHGADLVVYGRPNHCEAVTGRVDSSGWIPVTADFRTIDHKFYEDTVHLNSITISPGNSGGFIFPLAFPLNTVAESTQEDIVVVDGNTETWMRSKIIGPITAPAVEVVGYYTIQTAADFVLAVGETLEIDPRPWSRGVYKNGYINVAGKFTQSSRRISMQTLPPGTHQVVLRGIDPTGTATLETRWQYASTTW